MKKKAIVVVPTIREESIKRFLSQWEKQLIKSSNFDTTLLIVEDNPTKSFSITSSPNIRHYSWKDIDEDLKVNSWIIPRRADSIRSYGYYQAWLTNPDMIVTLDDDCYPYGKADFLSTHWSKLSTGLVKDEDRWVSTTKPTIRPRGLPYVNASSDHKVNNIVLNHGLWYNVPDFDGQTQLRQKKTSGLSGYSINQVIPQDKYFPMCGMNLAWKPIATPALYFLLMGESVDKKPWGYHRFGDIWAGVIIKKISDHLKYSISSGDPIIWHDRASNANLNYQKEKRGLKTNETFWKLIDEIELKGKNFTGCYEEVASHLGKKANGIYWQKTSLAMKLWLKLFRK